MQSPKCNRFFEAIPAILTWATLLGMVIASKFAPVWAAVFIIIFDTYWFFKTLFLSLHLRYAFNETKANLGINWLEEVKRVGTVGTDGNVGNGQLRKEERSNEHGDRTARTSWQDIYHLIVIPMSVEPYEVMRETFKTLRDMNYPKDKVMIALSAEDRIKESVEITSRIKEEFGDDFYKFLVTLHPANREGEIIGSGANETWGAMEAKRLFIDPENIPYEKILLSVFDADTQIPADYFGRLMYCFLTAEKPDKSSYQPIPLYNNNIYEAPALGRVVSLSATFWHMLQQARAEKVTTFSSQSMPFKALVDIGYWHTDVVSDDSRIFWQLYLHYDGDWRVVPMFYPVSMDANVAPTLFGTMKNIYKQQRRWAWGVENIPYLLSGLIKNKKISFWKKLSWTFNKIEGFHSWATNAILIFALGWLPVMLGGESFNQTLLSFNLPNITRIIMTFASIGIISSAVFGIALLPSRPEWFKFRHKILYVIQWALLPLSMIVFGAFPAIDAQTRLALGGKFRLGFWITPKSRKEVIEKRGISMRAQNKNR